MFRGNSLKILYAQHCSAIGGGSWCLFELVRELQGLDKTVECSALLFEEDPLADRLRSIGIPVEVDSSLSTITPLFDGRPRWVAIMVFVRALLASLGCAPLLLPLPGDSTRYRAPQQQRPVCLRLACQAGRCGKGFSAQPGALVGGWIAEAENLVEKLCGTEFCGSGFFNHQGLRHSLWVWRKDNPPL